MAPEVVCLERGDAVAVYDARVDVWSFGMLLFDVHTAHRPYAQVDRFALPSHVKSGARPTWPLDTAPLDERLLALFSACTSLAPADRWSWSRIVSTLVAVAARDANDDDDYDEYCCDDTVRSVSSSDPMS
eukprot:TRINITY_DN1203_c0_g1_i2.p2 TRINITY_DN1203_c0_g1~~TRINITY_DN1203_c0_g1_i2.p2  ORF type:complete len:130 (-),score=79.21 TRINITY_DN1203_c0_g1_i2:46-435(-)